jgi:hypothetical protein
MRNALLLVWILACACSVDHVVVATLEATSPTAGAAGEGGAGGAPEDPSGRPAMGGVSAGGVSAGGVSAGGVSAGGVSAGGVSAGGVSAGGVSGSAASSGLASSAGGVFATGGSLAETGAGRVATSSGGSNPVFVFDDAGAAGSDNSNILCSCYSAAVEVCGSDGVTYNGNVCGEDPCLIPTITCLHACPCLDGEAEPTAGWFPAECATPERCLDVVCVLYAGARPEPPTNCATAGQ